jgi:hypothetical protein
VLIVRDANGQALACSRRKFFELDAVTTSAGQAGRIIALAGDEARSGQRHTLATEAVDTRHSPNTPISMVRRHQPSA